ncbi:hypothetical protein H5407_20240 [Mitsuaria sp. WAJ17]|uniref:hypothetical protein n=1 Tax=Mitsuaria sp. WAJ17 TaxID=2761452 RepID=UPI0016005F17|nr:hypothetical protein [Mitsuaria sp. WAJ17]MBB2487571.1 hypothetical protein [Mitsuaria sp. WAJ17]
MKFANLALSLSLLSLPAFSGELPDATVAKILGLTSVTHTVRSISAYGHKATDVTYQDAQGKELVTLRLAPAEQFAMWKSVTGIQMQPFPALGGDAFQYKEFRSVCAKSGASAVCATPDFLNKSKPISDAQLAELIKAAF